MNELINGTQWSEYVETPCRKRQPVKLEQIVAQRIQAFMKVKQMRLKDLQSHVDHSGKKM